MATVDFRVGERAHITVDSRGVPLVHHPGLCDRLPGQPLRPHRRRRHSLQLRRVLRVRYLLHGVQRGRGHHLDLSGRRPWRRLPPRMSHPRPPAGPAPGPGGDRPLVVACLDGVRPPSRGRPADRVDPPRPVPAGARPPRCRRPGARPPTGPTPGRDGCWPWPPVLPSIETYSARCRPSVSPWCAFPAGGPTTALTVRRPTSRELGGTSVSWPAAIAAAIIRWGAPSLVLCGDRSADRGTGALPAFLAHELGSRPGSGPGVADARPGSPDQAPAARGRAPARRRVARAAPGTAAGGVLGRGRRGATAPGVAGRRPGRRAPRPSPWSPPVPPPIAADGRDERVRVGRPRPFRPRTRVLPPPAGDDPRIRLLALTGALVAHDPPTVVGPVSAPVGRRRAARLSGPPRVPARRPGPEASAAPSGPGRSGEPARGHDLAGGRPAHPGPGRSFSSPSGRPSSTVPICPSPPTPTSPWPWPTARPSGGTGWWWPRPWPTGRAGEHQGFAGTLSIGGEATELVLVELGRSAAHDYAHVVAGLDPRRQRGPTGGRGHGPPGRRRTIRSPPGRRRGRATSMPAGPKPR